MISELFLRYGVEMKNLRFAILLLPLMGLIFAFQNCSGGMETSDYTDQSSTSNGTGSGLAHIADAILETPIHESNLAVGVIGYNCTGSTASSTHAVASALISQGATFQHRFVNASTGSASSTTEVYAAAQTEVAFNQADEDHGTYVVRSASATYSATPKAVLRSAATCSNGFKEISTRGASVAAGGLDSRHRLVVRTGGSSLSYLDLNLTFMKSQLNSYGLIGISDAAEVKLYSGVFDAASNSVTWTSVPFATPFRVAGNGLYMIEVVAPAGASGASLIEIVN